MCSAANKEAFSPQSAQRISTSAAGRSVRLSSKAREGLGPGVARRPSSMSSSPSTAVASSIETLLSPQKRACHQSFSDASLEQAWKPFATSIGITLDLCEHLYPDAFTDVGAQLDELVRGSLENGRVGQGLQDI